MKPSAFALALAFGIGLLGSRSPTQTPSFPEQPIRILVGFSAGGGTDVIARILAQRMSETMGQSIVIENRTGASGLIAAAISV
ncbi:MAG TPA: tripartite tricarboxylate transporter substrate-binding protein [Xanthobacteraceae bacterium]|jgi:tripartite-type tricarboxylate transporter receptor subunit TctC